MSTDGPGWVADAVFYQLFPDRFASSAEVRKPGVLEPWHAPPTVHGFKGGDLRGVVEHLDYLSDLGITAIYLNPIFASAANHRYHPYDYAHVDPLLGGDEAFRTLVDESHARGMRIILDGVFNHTGRGFWAFHHLLENGRHSPYVDWYYLDRDALDGDRQLRAYPDSTLSGGIDADWGNQHGPGMRSLRELGYRAWWDLPALPKLNLENPEVRAYLFEIGEHWTRFGVDGWRLDVPQEVAPDFWHEWRDRIRRVNAEAYLVGEVWQVAPEWTAPAGPFDGLMNYPLAWAILGFAAGHGLDASVTNQQRDMREHVSYRDGRTFATELEGILGAYPLPALTSQLNLLGSHDTPRVRSVLGGDLTSVKLAYLLLMSLPGSPCIYYGDEIGLMGGGDPDCRGAFPWDLRSTWEDDLHEFVRSVIGVRRAEPALRGPDTAVLATVDDACVLQRGPGAETLWVAVNPGPSETVLRLPTSERLDVTGVDVPLSVGSRPEFVRATPRSAARLLLAARSGSILRPIAAA